MEGLRPHAEALDIPEVEREERLYQVSSNYTPKVLCLQLFHFFDFHPQLARQLVGAELQQIVYRLLVTSSNSTNYLRREYLPVVLGQSALGDLDSTETVDICLYILRTK